MPASADEIDAEAVADTDGPRVLPVAPKVGSDWWKYVSEIPVDQNPLLDPDGRHCDVMQPNDVYYLAGNWGGSDTRECTIPANTRVLVPLLNANNFRTPGEDPATHDELLAELRGAFTLLCSLYLLVDGEPVVDPLSLFVQSNVGFSITVPEENIYDTKKQDLAAGTHGPVAHAGFYAMLDSLPPGEHLVEFGGALCIKNRVVFETSLTYMLTVEDR